MHQRNTNLTPIDLAVTAEMLDEAVADLAHQVAAVAVLAAHRPDLKVFGWHLDDLIACAASLRCKVCGKAALYADSVCPTCESSGSPVATGQADPELRGILLQLFGKLPQEVADELHGAGTLDDLVNACVRPKLCRLSGCDEAETFPHCLVCDTTDDHAVTCPVGALTHYLTNGGGR